MERGTRWTMVVAGLAVGAGFGLVHVLWQAAPSEITPARDAPAPRVAHPADSLAVRDAQAQMPARGFAAGGPGGPGGVPYPPYGPPRGGPPGWPAGADPGYGGYPVYPVYPDYPTGPAQAPSPEAYSGGAWYGRGEYGGGYPGYRSPTYPPPPEQEAEVWWAPEFHDGPPPPEAEALVLPPAPSAADGPVAVPPGPGGAVSTWRGLTPHGPWPEAPPSPGLAAEVPVRPAGQGATAPEVPPAERVEAAEATAPPAAPPDVGPEPPPPND
jgi:hypothetical protein